MSNNAQSTGTVTLRSDTSALMSGVARSKDALQGMDAVLRRTGPALGDMSKAAKVASLGTDLLTAGVLGVVKGFGPWGMVIGVAADALIGYVANADAAAKATKEFWLEVETAGTRIQRMFRALDERVSNDRSYEQRLRNMTSQQREQIRATEDQIAAAKGYGEAVDELEVKLNKLRASAAISASRVRNENESDEEFEKRRAELVDTARRLERENELHEIEMEAAASSRTATKINVGGKRKGKAAKPEKDHSTDWEFLRELEAARDLADEKERKRREDEIEWQTMNERFDLIMQEREATAEREKEAAHERELQRIEEEKRAREEQLAQIEHITQASIGYAQMAVSGIVSITDARNNARRAAQAQGKSEREVAQAVRQAELQAKAARMQTIRDLMIAKAVEFAGLGLGALASTWGIPNPSSILYFAAAAAMGAGAAATGARANALSDQASGMQANGGGAFGPAGGNSGSGGGFGSGRSSTSGPPQPVGSGNAIPGSPVSIVIQGNVVGERQEIDRLARRLEERMHSRPRRTG